MYLYRNADNQHKRVRNGQTIAEGTAMLVVVVGLAMALLLLIVNTGITISIQQRANLVAYNAAEHLARRTYWLGLERNVSSPERETMIKFIKRSTSLQHLPSPNAEGFHLVRAGKGNTVFSVTYTYKSPLLGNLPLIGKFTNMTASGTYIRPNEGAPLMLRVVRANGSSILIPCAGLNGPNAVGEFTEPVKRFDGYFFWNTGQQQIESEKKPATLAVR